MTKQIIVELQTDRLRLLPLTAAHLRKLQKGRPIMEQHLGLVDSGLRADQAIRAEIEEALQFWLQYTEQHPETFYWGTNWEIILTAEECSIGGIGMGGAPDQDGQVTVGYHIDPRHQGKGYATEALCALRDWALRQAACRSMTAFTPVDNILSQRVLQKAGFQLVDRVEEEGMDCYRWQYPA